VSAAVLCDIDKELKIYPRQKNWIIQLVRNDLLQSDTPTYWTAWID